MRKALARKMMLGEYSGTSLRRRQVLNLFLTENRFEPGLSIAEHSHTYSHFTIVLEGSFVETYEGLSLECEKNTVLVVPRDKVHTDLVGPAGAHSVGVEISKSLERFINSHGSLLRRPRIVTGARLELRIQRIRKLLKVQGEYSSLELYGAAMDVINEVLREPEPPLPGASPPWLSEVLRLLECNLSIPASVAVLAEAVNRSPSHICRDFKDATGQSIGAYHLQMRLRYAQELLRSTKDSIALIAAETGFYDAAHFCRAFKSAFEKSPSNYRTDINLVQDINDIQLKDFRNGL
jgi:AraC-like DNA-binding protein/quercetin dioxygenase-like cupin family protein